MIRFLIKGLLRERSRSLFPILIVAAGVTLCVLVNTWMQGVQNDALWSTAVFANGHERVTTQAYLDEIDQMPIDLALMDVTSLLDTLNSQYPQMYWSPRIRFGGLLDIPDDAGETRSQSPVLGMALNLIGKETQDIDLMNFNDSLIRGRLPEQPGEILISDLLAQRLKVEPGETATIITTSMYGSMVMYNLKIAGTIKFGITALDRSLIVTDIADAQTALDMPDAASEILGFSMDRVFNPEKCETIKNSFNNQFTQADEFTPIMQKLTDDQSMGEMFEIFGSVIWVAFAFFVFVMSIVLWNAGLMASIRRYGEIGVRLAIGEEKGHVYRSMLLESIAIGIAGTILGTGLGLAISYYLQIVGVDISSMMNDATALMSDVMRARVTPESYVVGFIPGVVAPFIGTMISGMGIYKRQTYQLFKELEV